MTPTLHEVANSLFGAYRLARGDRDGVKYFEATPDAALRSFWVALVAFPPSMVLVIVQRWGQFQEISAIRIMLTEVIAYVINWAAFPVAMYYVASAIGREERYFGYLSVYNWTSLVQLVVLIPVILISQTGIFPDGLTTTVVMVSVLALLLYRWFIACASLGVSGGMAIGIVGMDTLLDILISRITDVLVAG